MNRWTSMLGAALLVAFVATPAAAQFGGDREIGFKLGLNLSTLDGDAFEEAFGEAETRTAFTGGGFLRLGLTNMLSIQPELMYSPKGTETTIEDNGDEFTFGFELDYIEIPLLVRADVAAGDMLSPYIYGGPAFAFEASCSITGEGGGFEIDADCDDSDADFELERKSFDVGAMVGGGLSFPAGPGSILIEGRYNFGLINIADTDDEDVDVKNRAGSVLAGYSISLGR